MLGRRIKWILLIHRFPKFIVQYLFAIECNVRHFEKFFTTVTNCSIVFCEQRQLLVLHAINISQASRDENLVELQYSTEQTGLTMLSHTVTLSIFIYCTYSHYMVYVI